MVDATNLHIFGITVALAWQLPHKTVFGISPADEPMHDERISVTNFTKKIDKFQEMPSIQTNHEHFNTYFNRSNYHQHKLNSNYLNYLRIIQDLMRPPLNKHNVRTKNDWEKYRPSQPKWKYSHYTYPALRMRRQIAVDQHKEQSIGTLLHPQVEQCMNHHRNTRFDLFKSVEKYLNA